MTRFAGLWMLILLVSAGPAIAAEIDPIARYRSAVAAEERGELMDALAGYDEAAGHFPGPSSALAAVRVLVKLGRTADAQARMRALLDGGFGQTQLLDADPVLKTMYDMPDLRDDLAAARARRFPCQAPGKHHEIDFWVGRWDVTMSGARIGGNSISRAAAGCVVLERWESALGETGASQTFYDAAIDRWRQIYVGDSGKITEYAGAWDGKEMRMDTDASKPPQRRMQLIPNPDGSVTQRFTHADAEQWVVEFEALYLPAKD